MAKTKPSKVIRSLSVLKDVPYSEIAKSLNMQEQSLNNKLYRNNYKVTELIKICSLLGVELGIKDGDNFYSLMGGLQKDE